MEARKQAYLAMIEQSAAVERIYAKKNQDREYDITPVEAPPRTVEEEQNDLTKQKQTAMSNARKFLSPEVAGEFVAGLGDEDLLLFNRYADDFGKEVKRFKSVDLLFLKALWSRYLEKMGKTYGIEIPLEKTDIKPPTDEVSIPTMEADEFSAFQTKMHALNPTMTERQIRLMYNNQFEGKERAEARAKELVKRSGEAEAQFLKDRDVVHEAVVTIPQEKARIRFPHVNEIERNRERIDLIEAEIDRYTTHLQRLLDESEDLLARDVQFRERRDITAGMRKKRRAEIESLLQENARDVDDARAKIRSLKTDRGAYLKDINSINRDLARDLMPVEKREKELRKRWAMRRSDPVEELDQYYTYGLEETRGGPRDEPDQDYHDDRFSFKGYGIRPAVKGPTLVQFGRYRIHRPALQKRELRLRFPSRAKIAKFPDRPLTARVAHALEMALAAGRLTSSMTQGLDTKEKNLLAHIGNFVGIDHHLQHSDEQAELERFELLRGEVCAGNDNPAIIKELKQCVLRFLGDGRLKQQEGQRILAELAIL